jgi:hypothetical protein
MEGKKEEKQTSRLNLSLSQQNMFFLGLAINMTPRTSTFQKSKNITGSCD